ncbi:MAG: ribonuclease E inhibitor RraB [Dermatophilaceae bacterium]|nr:ribonuclease E inhibitor RraB [Intrasporangiaceae bacterium]
MGDELDDQLQKNRETWSQLTEQGVRPGDAINVDAFFFAPHEEAATQLAEALSAAGWESQVSSSKTGLLRRKVSWDVQASRLVSGVDLGRLDALVTELEAAAAAHDSEFDGWGTELPPESR